MNKHVAELNQTNYEFCLELNGAEYDFFLYQKNKNLTLA